MSQHAYYLAVNLVANANMKWILFKQMSYKLHGVYKLLVYRKKYISGTKRLLGKIKNMVDYRTYQFSNITFQNVLLISRFNI